MDFVASNVGHLFPKCVVTPCHTEEGLYGAESQSFTYDDLNRLTEAKKGLLDSSDVVQTSDVLQGLNMDLLGNFTSAAGGIELNSASATTSHAVNATNEITSTGRANPAGPGSLINDPFTTSLSDFWTRKVGTWSISSSKVNVDSLIGDAVLLADPDLDMINFEVEVTFPTGSSTNKAGVVFCHDGGWPASANFYAVVIERTGGTNGWIALYKITNGSWGSALATGGQVTINDSTAYTIKVMRKQGQIYAEAVGSLTYNSSTDFGTGQAGLYSDKTNVTFDDFKAYDAPARDAMTPRTGGLADTSLSSGKLWVQGSTRRGENLIENFSDDDFMVQVDADPRTYEAMIWVRHTDANNGYRFRLWLDSAHGYKVHLHSFDDGEPTLIGSDNYGVADEVAVKIKLAGSSIKWPALDSPQG